MSERIDLDQLREQREHLAASIEEAEQEASDRRREAERAAGISTKHRVELKDLERRITRTELEQSDALKHPEDLRAELEKLRDQNERLERQVDRTQSLAKQVVLGSELRQASRTWLREARSGRPFGDEFADFGAAVIRRVVRVGIGGVVLASLPGLIAIGLTLWQNVLIREQNATMREQNVTMRLQNETIQAQLKDQREDTLIVRRAQLLDTIYEQICKDIPADNQGCKPKAPERARREAAQAFVLIENKAGNRIELREAPIRGTDLRTANLVSADLSFINLDDAQLNGANLRYASLYGAKLASADFSDADLRGADLRNAFFRSAELEGANLEGASLEGADFLFANLTGANLSGVSLNDVLLNDRGSKATAANLTNANLAGADLRGTQNLTQRQINSARGSEKTLLPDHLTMPDQWKSDIESDGER